MKKKLVNQKRDQLRKLTPTELIHEIRNYYNQDYLNYDNEGVKRKTPVGKLAENMEKQNVTEKNNQYYKLLHEYTKLIVPELRIMGTSFYKEDVRPETINKQFVARSKSGVINTYEVDFTLQPEPDNPYDKNAVKVMVPQIDGTFTHIGYVGHDFIKKYPITESTVMSGLMVDFSNGKFKNVSYRIEFDVEALDKKYGYDNSATSLTQEDIVDLEQSIDDLSILVDEKEIERG